MRLSSKLTMLLALAIGALALAACGDEDEAAPAADSPVAIDDVDGTDVLVDVDGRTLYTADVEEGPGELTGNGFVDDFQGTTFTWSVATAEGAAPASDSGGGGYGPGY